MDLTTQPSDDIQLMPTGNNVSPVRGFTVNHHITPVQSPLTVNVYSSNNDAWAKSSSLDHRTYNCLVDMRAAMETNNNQVREEMKEMKLLMKSMMDYMTAGGSVPAYPSSCNPLSQPVTSSPATFDSALFISGSIIEFFDLLTDCVKCVTLTNASLSFSTDSPLPMEAEATDETFNANATGMRMLMDMQQLPLRTVKDLKDFDLLLRPENPQYDETVRSTFVSVTEKCARQLSLHTTFHLMYVQ